MPRGKESALAGSSLHKVVGREHQTLESRLESATRKCHVESIRPYRPSLTETSSTVTCIPVRDFPACSRTMRCQRQAGTSMVEVLLQMGKASKRTKPETMLLN